MAKFEIKYLEITWYDEHTILRIQESYIPLKVECVDEDECFECIAELYPQTEGLKYAQLAFRYLENNNSEPYIKTANGEKISLKKIIDEGSGKTWWVEANFWKEKEKRWESKAYHTAGKMVVRLDTQTCQINICSSEFTIDQLKKYLSDFKSDLWELILDENSYITGKVKGSQESGINQESIDIINNILFHVQIISEKPKSELREIQELKLRKAVKPVARTFMEIATKGDGLYLTSRATKPTYNVPENQYILFILIRVYTILNQLVIISKSRKNRFKNKIETLSYYLSSFRDKIKIDKGLVLKDLERMENSCDLEKMNHSLNLKFKGLNDIIDPQEKRIKYFVKVGNKANYGNSFFCEVKKEIKDDWFPYSYSKRNVFLDFRKECYQELFKEGFVYEVTATRDYELKKEKNYIFYIKNLSQIKIIDIDSKRKNELERLKKKINILEKNNWLKYLTNRELKEQNKEKISIQNRLNTYEKYFKNASLVYDQLSPKITKYKVLITKLNKMGVVASPTFPNSMTFVQNPNYQALHSNYKNLLEKTNLSDEDILLSLEKIEEIGLINMPILYERWCLLQIIKVLIQKFHYEPDVDWKRKLLRIISNNTNEKIEFKNENCSRIIELFYELTLKNGKRPDFVLDVLFERKDGTKDKSRFIMDAKFYSNNFLDRVGGISAVVKQLYYDKDYSESEKNTVFVFHPAKNAITKRVSPQEWGEHNFFGEVEMFDWDKQLRQNKYHKYGAICVNPTLGLSYLDNVQRLLGMFLQYGIENNQLESGSDSDDVETKNFCVVCGSGDLLKIDTGKKSCWYECNICKHFTVYNHCGSCNTRLIKNGNSWTYHSKMPMEPFNIKCPSCENLWEAR